eukprot:2347864-Rhodomonas_salina.4
MCPSKWSVYSAAKIELEQASMHEQPLLLLSHVVACSQRVRPAVLRPNGKPENAALYLVVRSAQGDTGGSSWL